MAGKATAKPSALHCFAIPRQFQAHNPMVWLVRIARSLIDKGDYARWVNFTDNRVRKTELGLMTLGDEFTVRRPFSDVDCVFNLGLVLILGVVKPLASPFAK
jgi:hypothetical protein